MYPRIPGRVATPPLSLPLNPRGRNLVLVDPAARCDRNTLSSVRSSHLSPQQCPLSHAWSRRGDLPRALRASKCLARVLLILSSPFPDRLLHHPHPLFVVAQLVPNLALMCSASALFTGGILPPWYSLGFMPSTLRYVLCRSDSCVLLSV